MLRRGRLLEALERRRGQAATLCGSPLRAGPPVSCPSGWRRLRYHRARAASRRRRQDPARRAPDGRRVPVHEPGAPAAAPPSSAGAPLGGSLSAAAATPRAQPGDGGRRRRRPGEQVLAGLEEHKRRAAMRKSLPGLLGVQPAVVGQELPPPPPGRASSSSESEEETTQDEASSSASEVDGTSGAEVKKEQGSAEQPGEGNPGIQAQEMGFSTNSDALMGLSRCPLCQLECGSREQLVTHVYQHTAAAVSAKSYLCPVCSRALSSPGSLGRHLLIHSEDQLSNCAVCGAHFTSHATFNSEKVPEVLSGDSLPTPPQEGSSSTEEKAATLSPAVYPAGLLLVCNSCVAYRKLLEAQAPGVRKWALRRQNEPLEARLQRLERERTAKKSRRDNETPEEREVRRMRDREAKRLQRMQETDEQRARRLQRDREAMRLKRANETPEKRQARLIREREAKRLKRRLEKMDMMLRAQFGQDPSAMAALAAEMNFFPLPGGGMELDSQLLSKMSFEEPSPSTLH
ncbi:zinc finger protein 821 isoform X1 [Pseudonaja textilis]|uniref:zinc finger protein 821 isoform X1 n=1 Tax=Pseudonaja textilis TaxID=8673 RepID=UPI000EA91A86|nr:zinc finger protein 821 isoform X1 [Pseudonaja textilis]